jgi:hypothetical protein
MVRRIYLQLGKGTVVSQPACYLRPFQRANTKTFWAAPAPNVPFPIQKPFAENLVQGQEEGAKGARHMGVRSPLTPTLSPLEKGGEGGGSGGM